MQNKNDLMHPYQKQYWVSAFSEMKNLRKVVFAALVIAMRVALAGIFIPVGPNLRIYFHFFVTAFGGLVCGPVMALAIGFGADILGVLLFPSGAFFFGYTVSAMVGAFVYGIFLYKRPISMVRLALCKAVVSLGVNVALGSLWSAILYSKGYYYYFVQSVTKNILLLPVEVGVLYLFFKLILPAAAKINLIPAKQAEVTLL